MPHPAASRAGPLPDGLTEREAEVLALIAEGLSNTEIADRLFVAETTVKTHINRIFAKTQSRDRAQAALYAHRNGLTSGPTAPGRQRDRVRQGPNSFRVLSPSSTKSTPSLFGRHDQPEEIAAGVERVDLDGVDLLAQRRRLDRVAVAPVDRQDVAVRSQGHSERGVERPAVAQCVATAAAWGWCGSWRRV